jgi:Zn-dependent protease with chaperone function
MHSAAAYASLVAALQQSATANPRWYRFKLMLLAGFGYAVLLIALLLALSLSVGLGVLVLLTKSVWAFKLIKLAWVPLLLAWLILRALWVQVAGPQGRLLGPGEAPALWAEVERLRRATGAPRLAGIFIDSELNAAAQSVPRLLGLAGNRHYLVLGLPLLRALEPAEASAVIAHEFGHFNAGHGRFAGRIYRVRATWYRLLESLQEQSAGAGALFVRFFNWFAPYFYAYSFVLARENEYEADAVSARLAGAETSGRALVRVELAARRLQERFWPEVVRLSLVQAEPPAAVHADMVRVLQGESEGDSSALAEAMARPAGLDDTHPTLAQRLAALRLEPSLPRPMAQSAAELWLGEFAEPLQAEFDAQWRERVATGWEQRHAEHAETLARLAQLDEKRTELELDDGEYLEYALRLDQLETTDGGEDVVAHLRKAAERNPSNALVHYQLGARLLADDSAEGVSMLERAMSLETGATEAALTLLAHHHQSRGDTHARDAALQRLQQWRSVQERAQQERQVLSRKDLFESHGLDDEHLGVLQRLLQAQGKIAKAWLARKHIEGGGSVPHFVLVLQRRFFTRKEDGELQRLVNAIDVPGSLMAIDASSNRSIAKAVRQVVPVPTYCRA